MLRTHGVTLAALALIAAAAGALEHSTAQAQPAHGKGEEPGAVAPTGATEEILQEARGYRSWQKFPRYAQQPAFSKGHGKAYVVAWYNDAAGPSVKAGGQSYPDGSIIVKENRPKAGRGAVCDHGDGEARRGLALDQGDAGLEGAHRGRKADRGP